MLYHLFEYLEANFKISGAGLFQYITFRAGLAIILSLIISMIFGRKIIDYLRRKQVGEDVRDLGLAGQKQKQGTPTMGGVIIILAIVVPCLLLARLDNVYTILALLATLWMGAIGFTDDYIKVFKRDKRGLKGRFKVLGQVILGLIIAVTMLVNDDVVIRMDANDKKIAEYEVIKTNTITENGEEKTYAYVKAPITNVPFLKDNELDYSKFLFFLGDNAKTLVWIIFIPLVIFIVSAVSNGSNLTDGLDGLATGVAGIVGATLAVLAYVSGNAIAADYLNILYLPGISELVIFSACFLGACLGFLWYNSFPAQVFMGDTGSLTLGSIIAALAILLRKELLIPILCGVFLAENLSVMIQVSYFKYTKRKYGEGRRIFLMSPLHHHYQKKDMHEVKIVIRFWLVSIILAVMTILTLKIR